MFEKTISYRRKKFKDANKQQFKARQDRLNNQSKQLSVTEFLPNDKESIMGISHNFSSPILTTNFGFFTDELDEPVRIQAIRAKSRTQKLSSDDIKQLQRYYYMQNNQQDKDNRFVLGESYKVGKKLLGLNVRNAQVAVN